MPARVIQFGVDECHRSMVLRNAGYSVDECVTLLELRQALSTETGADAVCVSECDGAPREEAISLARTHCEAPLVLFQGTSPALDAPEYDLVVPNLTPPDVWLEALKTLIAQSRMARNRALILRSERIRLETAALALQSLEKRRRPRLETEHNPGRLDSFAKLPPDRQ